MFRSGPDLLRALTATFHAIETNGTGIGAFRPTFAEFLGETSELLGAPALRETAERYRALGVAWSALADAALPDEAAALGKTRRLLREKERLICERGAAGLTELRGVNEQLHAVERAAADTPPVSVAEALDLFTALRDRLVHIAAEERQAVAALQAALGTS